MSRTHKTNNEKVRSSGRSCHYCGSVATTADHVVPRAKGGTDAQWNLVPACTPCNQSKADQLSGCGCGFCITAVRLWRYPEIPRPAPLRRMQHEHSYPLPMLEVAKLQNWLDRNLPGQTV